MSRVRNGLMGWMVGAVAVLAILSGASLAALSAVPMERGGAPSSPAADAGGSASPSAQSLVLAALPGAAGPAVVTTPTPADLLPVSMARAAVLRDFLVQDCGSCHGLTLGGGLGPPLLRERLADKPVPYLAYVILNGRPGTAMPPWSGLLTAAEGEWLARELRGENP